MWNLISHFLTFAGGMASGVMLMCLMQTGKLADIPDGPMRPAIFMPQI